MKFAFGLAFAALLMSSATIPTALAKPPSTPPGQANGHVTVEDVVLDIDVKVVTTTEQFMGMSNKTPPNEHAAASKGVRTETTTTTTTTTTTGDVTGPKGEVENNQNYDCDNCTWSNTSTDVDVDVETSSTGPGNSSHGGDSEE